MGSLIAPMEFYRESKYPDFTYMSDAARITKSSS